MFSLILIGLKVLNIRNNNIRNNPGPSELAISEILIGRLCNLKFTVLHDKNKSKIINSKQQQPDFVCIYLP